MPRHAQRAPRRPVPARLDRPRVRLPSMGATSVHIDRVGSLDQGEHPHRARTVVCGRHIDRPGPNSRLSRDRGGPRPRNGRHVDRSGPNSRLPDGSWRASSSKRSTHRPSGAPGPSRAPASAVGCRQRSTCRPPQAERPPIWRGCGPASPERSTCGQMPPPPCHSWCGSNELPPPRCHLRKSWGGTRWASKTCSNSPMHQTLSPTSPGVAR